MLTTSLLLTFASLAFAQQVTVITETVTLTVATGASVYTTTYESTSYPVASTSSISTSTSTSTASAATHTIQVGPNGTLTYNPNNIVANVGDVIQYIFDPNNHTVTQSSFGSPCVGLAESTGNGFDSGFGHNTTVPGTMVGFQFTVNNTNPIWYYCRQKNHCVQGMVGAINAPTTGNNTFAAFLAKAEANSSSSATPSGTATGTATGASSSSTGVGTNSSGAIYTSVNVGLTTILAFAGVVILAL